MKLVSDWWFVLRTAWSARLALLSAFLGGLEVAAQVMAPQWGGYGAIAAIVASLAATLARVVHQAKLRRDEQQQGQKT